MHYLLPVFTSLLLLSYSAGPFHELIGQEGVQNDKAWVDRATQVGKALGCLHRTRRMHLDIKPSNIIIGAEVNAVLIDIGGAGSYSFDWLSPEMKDILQDILQQEADVAPVDLASKRSPCQLTSLFEKEDSSQYCYVLLMVAFKRQIIVQCDLCYVFQIALGVTRTVISLLSRLSDSVTLSTPFLDRDLNEPRDTSRREYARLRPQSVVASLPRVRQTRPV